MLIFYGLNCDLGDSSEFKIYKDLMLFEQKSKEWLKPKNHNFLRITRILFSLKSLGFKPTAKAFHECLSTIYEDNKGIIGPLTKDFWDKAIE